MSSTAERLAYAPTAVMPDRAVQAATGQIASGVIIDLSALESLGAEWQALERASGCSHQLFQTFAWCMHWARAAARLASDRQQLCVITVRDNGRLVLVCPLAIVPGRFFTTATWLGEPLTQYGDIIVADGPARERWIAAAWEAAVSLERVDLLWLRRVRGDALIKPTLSKDTQRLPDFSEALAMDMTKANGWAEVEARFKAKSVKNRKRHRRRLSEKGGLSFVFEEHSAQALDLARRAVALKRDWIAQRGLAFDPFKDAVYREALWSMVRGDEPRLACKVFALQLDGEPAAIDIAFNFKGRHFAHIAAMNLAYENFGPGNLLTEDVIRIAFERGERTYDLMAPAAPYKEDWTDTRTPVHAYARPLTLKGGLVAELYLAGLRPRLKALAERLPPGLKRLLARH